MDNTYLAAEVGDVWQFELDSNMIFLVMETHEDQGEDGVYDVDGLRIHKTPISLNIESTTKLVEYGGIVDYNHIGKLEELNLNNFGNELRLIL